MSYMGWIAQMLSDNTYEQFKELYIKAHENNDRNFIFEGSNCDTVLGKHICIYVDTYLQENYENHLIEQAELSNKYEELINKEF